MKCIVTIIQKRKYDETLVGEFDNLAVVQQFIDMITKHFKDVAISIEVVTEEEAE